MAQECGVHSGSDLRYPDGRFALGQFRGVAVLRGKVFIHQPDNSLRFRKKTFRLLIGQRVGVFKVAEILFQHGTSERDIRFNLQQVRVG